MASGSSDNRVNSLIWGVVLALAGIGLLLFNLDLFVRYEPYVQYVASALLGLLALGFIGSYVTARFSPAARRGAGTSGGVDHWWRLIPAWTLVALAVMVFLTTLPALDQRVTAGVLFVGQAIAFAHIYLLDRAGRWWAIIPGGFMLMLGGTIALSSVTEEPAASGHGAFRRPGSRLLSAVPVGAAAAIMVGADPRLGSGAVRPVSLFSRSRRAASGYLRWWPLLLPLLGAWLIWRATRPLTNRKLATNSAPSRSGSTQPVVRETDARPRRLGEYGGPAPGAAVEVMPDPEGNTSEKRFGDGRLSQIIGPLPVQSDLQKTMESRNGFGQFFGQLGSQESSQFQKSFMKSWDWRCSRVTQIRAGS